MEQEKIENKKRLTPESTILLTIATMALVTVVCGLVYFIVTRI